MNAAVQRLVAYALGLDPDAIQDKNRYGGGSDFTVLTCHRFSVLKYYTYDIFDSDTWEDFIRRFTNNEHIITFINDETNYQLKINAEGLYYSLDGSTWQHVLTEPVSEEPIEPDPEPDPEP